MNVWLKEKSFHFRDFNAANELKEVTAVLSTILNDAGFVVWELFLYNISNVKDHFSFHFQIMICNRKKLF